ncbi:MAG: FtsX-like permease family protein [Bacteroidota bacterium]
MKELTPPKWPLLFLRFFLKPDYLEEIEGDLEEIYADLLEEVDQRRANLIYSWEVIRLLRPNLIRHFNFNHRLNNYDMAKHHFLLILRSFMRYKSTFVINLLGLTIGLSCAFLALLWVSDELNKDRFHAQDDQLYQVMQNNKDSKGIETIPNTPCMLAETLVEEHPEVIKAVPVLPPNYFFDPGVLLHEDKTIRVAEQYVGKDFFEVFSFKVLDGDAENVLQTKEEIMLSDDLAYKLFGTTEGLIGKSLEWSHEFYPGNYVITGIFEKPGSNSSMQFDLLFNFDLFFESIDYLKSWGNNEPSTYVVLEKGVDPAVYNEKLAKFLQTKIEDIENTFTAHPYSRQYLYGNYENGQEAGGRITYVRLFSIITLISLLIAAINFINLSTAQASRRMKEIGVKKVIGAGRRTLVWQYLGEALLLATFSFVLAVGITGFLLPAFNELVGKQLTFLNQFWFWGSTLGITFLTGLIAGLYPALYLSRFTPGHILKGVPNRIEGKGVARHFLVAFQFVVSILLIVSALVVYKQTQLIQSKNLGYDRANIVYFNVDEEVVEKGEALVEELKKHPNITNVTSFSHDLMGNHGGTSFMHWEGREQGEKVNFGNLEVGYDFIETLDIQIKEGRSYSKAFPTDKQSIIFNEAAIEAMGIEDPVGKKVSLWRKDREIIGVAKNFHFENLYNEIKPCFLIVYEGLNKIMIKMSPDNQQKTIAFIEDTYQAFGPQAPFEYRFLDEDYQNMYVAEQQMKVLSLSFCIIAILISCLGLFGLMAFAVERRQKEMSIRKILGAAPLSIMYLLSLDTLKVVLIAVLLAVPLSYWINNNWLNNFAYRIDLQWWFFLGAGLLTIVIAWITIGFQSLKVAMVNPAETLKRE